MFELLFIWNISPLLGANINAKMNIDAKVSTMLAPDGRLKVRLKNIPITAADAPIPVERAIITGSLLVKR